VLLARKAENKRKETGDAQFYAPTEKIVISVRERAENILARPFKILFLEVCPAGMESPIQLF
jgi:hypothetical protein